jgi:hypothetical protein
MTADRVIRALTLAETELLLGWAHAEGWNPALADTAVSWMVRWPPAYPQSGTARISVSSVFISAAPKLAAKGMDARFGTQA